MFNSRPLNDTKTQEALRQIMQIMQDNDLAGAVMLINAQESGFAYHLPASWSAVHDDPATPMGLRIRARQAEIGAQEAERLLTGAAWTFCALSDFGAQTYKWANDFIKLLQDSGLQIEHEPFSGQSLGTIRGYDIREGRQ